MTKTEYQQHLIEEYASYLRKAIANKTQNYELTPQGLAAALLKAFEKGATKGILYESQNDIEKVSGCVQKPTCEKKECKQEEQRKQQSDAENKADDALKAFADLFARYLTGNM